MPYLHLRIAAAESSAHTESIAASLLTHTRDILGKKPEVTAIDIEYTRPRQWFVGGVPVSDKQEITFYLDVKITEGTNTKKQKAQYIKAVFSDMQEILGALTKASYIVLHDVRADAWGFEGRTQKSRIKEKQAA
jgi:4-oxalocrotonate tautomerase